ncbi:hypothetical protein EYW49_20520 [Siculibacillus lacustris]|uniref:Putative tail fiber protein gp53-like C-terminal domain-containing protein n=1 Tax=Siculibacillus lacustris TaxID=1549641 RepID=A0A4Q9VG14_9HYPH|nr:hypothetical protein [Siculibacillus lacustris]TBW33346.1 hypothetical protein EYW49_20520 [Siculibacillus lacustris]
MSSSRPGEDRVFGALDTYFRSCSSLTAGDGTRVLAGWLNQVTALLRQAIRQGGVAEDNTDDLMLWKSIASRIGRGGDAMAGPLSAPAGFATAARLLAAATTLTAGDAGKLVEITAASTVTTTLPTPVGNGGAQFAVYNASGVSQTLATVAGGFVGPGIATVVTTLSLATKGTAVVESDGSNWVSVAGSAYVDTKINDVHLFASNGYQKLPSGLILQWATGADVTSSHADLAMQTVTFPMTFPTACLTVITSKINTSNGGGNDYWFELISKTAASCVIALELSTYADVSSPAAAPMIFAIGY